MKNKTSSLIVVLLALGLAKAAVSDSVVLRDGTLHQGTITGATDATVTILVKSEAVEVPHAEILSLVFTSADRLYFKLNATLECKVVNKIGAEVVVVTSDGVENIPNSKIKKVEYNVGRQLKVTGLPPTGPQFVNKSANLVWAGDFKPNVYLGLHLGTHYAFLTDWKRQFSPQPSTRGLDLGGELGYMLNRFISLGAGYEYFLFQKVKVSSPNAEDRVSSSFFFANMRLSINPRSTPALFIYGKADVGALKGKEKISGLQGLTLEASGNVFAYRLKIGADYFTSGNISHFIELGYLAAKVDEILC
ncbi:MAG: outer membrane protein [bacterium]